jgi:hypothetical protein
LIGVAVGDRVGTGVAEIIGVGVGVLVGGRTGAVVAVADTDGAGVGVCGRAFWTALRMLARPPETTLPLNEGRGSTVESIVLLICE